MINRNFFKLNFKEFIILSILLLNFLSSSYQTYQNNKRLELLLLSINTLKSDIKEDYIKHVTKYNASVEKTIENFSNLSQKNESVKDAILSKIAALDTNPKIIITNTKSNLLYDYLSDPNVLIFLATSCCILYMSYSLYWKYIYVTTAASSYLKAPLTDLLSITFFNSEATDKEASKVIDISNNQNLDEVIDVSNLPNVENASTKADLMPQIIYLDLDKLNQEKLLETVFYNPQTFQGESLSVEEQENLSNVINNILDDLL